jgi:hypothetical protein
MGGHLWSVIEKSGDKYLVVTTSDNETVARETFRKTLGSTINIEKVEYVSFVHAVQS